MICSKTVPSASTIHHNAIYSGQNEVTRNYAPQGKYEDTQTVDRTLAQQPKVDETALQ